MAVTGGCPGKPGRGPSGGSPFHRGSYHSEFGEHPILGPDKGCALCFGASTKETTTSDPMIMRMSKADLADLDYVMLSVTHNQWLKEGGQFKASDKGLVWSGSHTIDLDTAVRVKRPIALQQFEDSCNHNSTEYNVPVRVVDIVMCMMLGENG